MKKPKNSRKKIGENKDDDSVHNQISEIVKMKAISEPMALQMSAVDAVLKGFSQKFSEPMALQMSAVDAVLKGFSQKFSEPMALQMSAVDAVLKGFSQKFSEPMISQMSAVQGILQGMNISETLSKIGQQQARIFEPWKDWASQFGQSTDHFHLNELQDALSGVTSRMAVLSAITDRKDILENIEEASEGLVNINDIVLDRNYVTKQDIEDLKVWLSKSLEKRKDKKSIADIILYVIGVIWMFIEISNFVLEKIQSSELQAATRKDIDDLKREVFDSLRAFERKSEIRRSWRDCKIYHRAQIRSFVLGKLPKDTEVTILLRNHKWVYISFINSENDLLQTGWVLKKYLATEKPGQAKKSNKK